MSRMLSIVAMVLVVAGIGNGVRAAGGAEMVVKQSAAAFAETVQRLQAEIEERGAKVAATIDHAAAAQAKGLELRPTTLIVFGNPALGTPLMQQSQTAGIDLPLRMLVWQDEGGTVQIGYWPPSRVADDHGIDSTEVTDKMSAALEAIAGAAASP